MALQITDLVSQGAIDQLKELNKELKNVKETFDNVAKNLAINVNVKVEGREDLANLTKVITTNFNALNNATKKAEDEQNKFSAAVGQEVKTIKEAQQYNKELRKVRNSINVTTNEGQKVIKAFNDQINKNTKLIKDNTDAYSKLKMGIGKYFEGFTKGALILKGVELAISGVKKGFELFKKAIYDASRNIRDFEYANSTLQSVLGANEGQMKVLQEQAMLLGRNTKYTAQEVTQLQTELARLGFATDDIHAMSEAVLKFGLVTGGSMADSAALAGAMIRTFGASAEETERYVSAMTIATNKSALSFGKLQTGLPLVAGAANALGWEIEDVLALYGKLADSGMSASIAATALRNILGQLANENGAMQKSMGGNIKTLEDFVGGLQKLKKEGVSLSDTMNEKLGGKRGGVALYNLVQMSDTILDLRKNVTGVTNEFNKSAEIMQNNVQSSVYSLKSAWQDLTLAFYESKGSIKYVIDFFTNAVRSLADSLRTYEQRLARAKEMSMSEADKSIYSANDNQLSVAQKINRLIEERTAALMAQNSALSENEAKQQAVDYVREKYAATYQNINARIIRYNQLYSQLNDEMEREIENAKDIDNWMGEDPATSGAAKLTEAIEKKYQPQIMELAKSLEYAKQQKIALDKVFSNAISAKAYTDGDFNLEDYTGDSGSKTLEEANKLQKELDKLNEMSAKAQIALAAETEEKKSLTIIAKYEKMIAEINRMELVSQTKRNAVIAELRMAMNAELLKNEEDFSSKRAQIDAKNWAAAYGKNRKNAQNAEQTLLDANRAKELREAEQMGYDKEAIMEKYWALQFELNNKYRAYDIAMEKTNIKNKLEYIQLGTEEEFALRKKLLDLEYEEELKNAEKTGADMEAIRKKYANKIATAQIGQKNNRLSETTTRIDTEQSNAQSDLMEAFRKGEMDETTYNLRSEQNARKYAVARLQATIDTMEEELKIADLTTDQEAELYNKIAKAREELNKTLLDSDKATFKAMIDNVEKWASAAQEAFSAIAGFMSQNYEIEIDQLEDEKDKLDEKYDADVERIERMEEQGAISSEDAEARKRAAKDQTEQKQKEISKKQQELAYKQAVWDKAASASQTAISTALGIMKVWAAEGTNASKVVMSALVAAQGAMQLATILATPIPKYAKGTEGHKGGLAVVGDGGRSEFVVMGTQGWVTPSTSTLVDLPKGAQVFPDAKSVMMTLPVYNENGKQVKVVNDYKELERKQKTANGLLKVIAANTRGNSNYNQYKQTIW